MAIASQESAKMDLADTQNLIMFQKTNLHKKVDLVA